MGLSESREVYISFSCGENIPPETLKTGCDGVVIGRKFVNDIGLSMVVYNLATKQAFLTNGQKVVDFELLTGRGHCWCQSSDGNIPPNAVPGGLSASDETLYIGRTQIAGKIFPGIIRCSEKCIEVNYDGAVVKRKDYEVLTSVAPNLLEAGETTELLKHAVETFKASKTFEIKQAEYTVEVYPPEFDPDDLELGNLKIVEANLNAGELVKDECSICMEKCIDSIYYPCGHMTNCQQCSTNEKKRVGICPICRTNVQDIIRIFKTF